MAKIGDEGEEKKKKGSEEESSVWFAETPWTLKWEKERNFVIG